MNTTERFLFAISHRNGGGAERAITHFANSLARNGFEVHFIQLFLHENDYALSSEVKFHYIEQPQVRNKLVRRIKHIVRVFKEIRAIQPTYMIPMLETMEYVGFAVTRFSKINFIYTIRNNPADMPKKRLERWFRNCLAFFSTAVFVQNEKQKAYFPTIMHQRVFAVPNMVGESFLKVQTHEIREIKRIVTAGRLNVQKNHQFLIKAFSKVVRNHRDEDIELFIYGAGPEENKLKSLVQDLNLQDKVKFPGRCEELETVYANSDLFVLSSSFEGMPNALMEAMAVGLPCISTDCETGPADLITPNENGILVKCNDINAMVDAIEYAIAHPEEVCEMGKKAKETIREGYSASAIAKKLVNECREHKKH